MQRSGLHRMSSCLSGAWLGVLLCIAFLAAPAAFAALGREMAGVLVGKLFEREAALSLVVSVLFVMALRRLTEHESGPSLQALATDARLWAVLGAMLCTLLGYYALQPLMEAARAGQGGFSFGALHGISVGLFGLKILLVTLLAWRLSR